MKQGDPGPVSIVTRKEQKMYSHIKAAIGECLAGMLYSEVSKEARGKIEKAVDAAISVASAAGKPVICIGHHTIDRLKSGETVEIDIATIIPASDLQAPTSVDGSPLLDWAVSKWNDEVKHRPLVNVHRRSLDDAWRQVIRWAGGDPVKLVGPSHDDLLAARAE